MGKICGLLSRKPGECTVDLRFLSRAWRSTADPPAAALPGAFGQSRSRDLEKWRRGLAREKKNYLISLGELIGPLGAKMPAGAEGGSVLVDIPLSSRAREHPYMQLGALISGFIQISRKLEQAPYLLADTRIPSVSLYDHLALTAGLAAVPARELLQPGGSRRRCVG